MQINVTPERKLGIEKAVKGFADSYYRFNFNRFEEEVLKPSVVKNADEFFYCTFVAKKYFLRDKKAFIESYIEKGFPLDTRFYIFFAPYCDPEYIEYYYSSEYFKEDKLNFFNKLLKSDISEDLAMMIYSESINLANYGLISVPFTQLEHLFKSESSNYNFIFSSDKKSAASLSTKIDDFYFLNSRYVIKKLYPEYYIGALTRIIKRKCGKTVVSYFIDGLLLSLYVDDRIQYEMLMKEENIKKYVDQYKLNEIFLLISGSEENISKKGFVRFE